MLDIRVGVGKSVVMQKFTLIEPQSGGITIVLGREFLVKLGSTEFDWVNGKIKLRNEWFSPRMWLRGGNSEDRISLVQEEVNQ